MSRLLISPMAILLVLFLQACSTVPKLWNEPIIEKQVEYVKQEFSCGPEPQVDALALLEYEPIVIPPLLDLGAPVENIPEYLSDHLDHGWMALSLADWEDVDRNDIDKLRYTKQLKVVIDFYRKCVKDNTEAGPQPE